MSRGTPPAEVKIHKPLVKKLLYQQAPQWSHLPLTYLAEGWDNVNYRLGEELIVRLPRRLVAADLILHEQKWLPQISDRMSLSLPVPIHIGNPAEGYPWHWSIMPWVEGNTANIDFPIDQEGISMAKYLKELHIPVEDILPKNEHRGVPLINSQTVIEERFNRIQERSSILTQEIFDIWHQALEVPFDKTLYWIHGDLHAKNVIVNNGKITSIIDWGDMTSGDRASDLVSIWSLFPNSSGRRLFVKQYSPSADLLARAKGWAIYFAAVLLDTGFINNKIHANMGKQMIERLLEDEKNGQ